MTRLDQQDGSREIQYDPGEKAYVTVHSDRDLTTVDTTIVEAVADVTDSELTEIPPLYDVIDPEALGELFAQPLHTDRRSRTEGTVSFRLAGCGVCFHADGRVVVTPPENE